MTIKERLLQEYECAIYHCFGDIQDEEYNDDRVLISDLDYINRKVKSYLNK